MIGILAYQGSGAGVSDKIAFDPRDWGKVNTQNSVFGKSWLQAEKRVPAVNQGTN